MSAWAKPGVRCVCVESTSGWHPLVDDFRQCIPDPVIGTICVIEAVYEEWGFVWLQLEGYDVDYSVDHFRPVAYPKQSLEHDIALFLDTPAHVRTSDKERA